MPLIRPISDLRNRAMEISELCHKEGQPVFITRNGKGDMVVMSLAHYERLQCLLELYQKLGEAESLGASGERGITHEKLMKNLGSIWGQTLIIIIKLDNLKKDFKSGVKP